MKNRKYISVKESIERWGVGKTTIYKLLASNAIEAVKLQSRTLISVESGDAYFAALPRFEGGAS